MLALYHVMYAHARMYYIILCVHPRVQHVHARRKCNNGEVGGAEKGDS